MPEQTSNNSTNRADNNSNSANHVNIHAEDEGNLSGDTAHGTEEDEAQSMTASDGLYVDLANMEQRLTQTIIDQVSAAYSQGLTAFAGQIEILHNAAITRLEQQLQQQTTQINNNIRPASQNIHNHRVQWVAKHMSLASEMRGYFTELNRDLSTLSSLYYQEYVQPRTAVEIPQRLVVTLALVLMILAFVVIILLLVHTMFFS